MRKRSTGQARLAKWMEKERVTQREAAVLLSMHYTHLNQILHGRRSVGLALALRIEECAGIPVAAWLSTVVDSAARKHLG